MEQVSLVQQLEKLLFMARNNKVKVFVGMVISDKDEAAELLHIPEDQTTRAVGLVSLMLRDVQTMCPVFDLSEVEPTEVE